ncbi:hypothetical protein GCM10023084_40700 [Streptomyces lacrimifluminis]|uniref:Uncharacterized protein n=1 Tax=Streptomyces lacrimifluminis TaxID=1500077 RepID=A0A917L216_9ACTN|nr:hypothetical protein GCM10012282_42320 [Streptomyces lacrimifluminis]
MYRLRLVCKLRARVSALFTSLKGRESAEAPPRPATGQSAEPPQQNPKKSAPKETEP